MHTRFPLIRSLTLALLLACTGARADVTEDIVPLQQKWAEIRYQMPENERAKAFEALAAEADKVTAANPGKAEALIWQGIILSTWAGAKGGLGALSLCKRAKTALEQALSIDPNALQGSAYTSLGSLYYQVPGWPVGFGDDDKAEEMLKKALAIAPDGIDANYFYGDYLYEQERFEEALKVLEHAAAAPPRPGREAADAGRQAEIAAKIAEVKEELEG